MRKAIVLTTAGLFLMIGLLAKVDAVLASAQGQQIFNEHCAMCHGKDGKGNGPASSAYHPPPKDFHRPDFWQGKVREKITNTIKHGHKRMPPISLSSSQIEAVINYMEQTFKPKS
jgi:mono/diheme cytochrome c family protein